ncbi:MAG: (deoxy)nucleoside triphosphate pyrophosphohydrolase [Clostridiales bacterium]|nr:(deoxy)nucleoside triphosphate pyrophosphohydrolase [Clostridiales bacterium]
MSIPENGRELPHQDAPRAERCEDVKKTVRVVAAILRREDGKIFATQRGYGEYKDGWEFPGGKIEPGETPQQALIREIREELAAEITVGALLTTVEYDYPAFHLSMDCFWAELVPGEELHLLEHESAKWVTLQELETLAWLPADVEVVKAIVYNGGI